jgi:peptidoglycan/LPS O-acetylase OafA/YrhL
VTAAAPRLEGLTGRRFRPDIQALRAIAVSTVLLFHAGVPGFDGGFVGVDVFFVISGFLITTHLVHELEREGRVRLALFYARRARRILPAAMVVLAATVVAVILVVPPPLAAGFLRDAAATAVYAPNIAFAVQGTDYLAESAPSPFQHYWSLGVEEQFYLGWPLLLGLLWLLLRRRRARVAVATVILVAVSFGAGVILTQVSPPWAFFGVGTRAWELGVGALVALATPALSRLPQAARLAAAVIGLAGILASATLYSSAIAFPGVAAALQIGRAHV